jgi:hypothetical protein
VLIRIDVAAIITDAGFKVYLTLPLKNVSQG